MQIGQLTGRLGAKRLFAGGLRSRALSITVIYTAIAFLWIYFSDQALFALLQDPDAFARWSVYKGLFYVLVTAALLYFLMRKAFGALEAAYTALKESERQLNRSRAQLHTIIESAMDAIVTVDDRGRIVIFNEAAARMFHCTSDSALGQPLQTFLPIRPEEQPDTYVSLEAHSSDGRTIPVEAAVSRIRRPEGALYTVIMRDTTQQRSHEAEIQRLNRLYEALSSINQAIVGKYGRHELFEQVCRILVEFGALSQSWIAWHDPGLNRLLPVASFGRADEFVRDFEIRLDDLDHMVGQNGRTFIEGQAHICNDMAADPEANPWRRGAMEHGFCASAVFPLRKGGKVLGTLNVYADTTGFFQSKEITLLNRVADDVSHALDGMVEERNRRKAEAALRDLNRRLERKVADRTRDLEASTLQAMAADRLKSAFLATMSHELRTPLNSIIGFTGIVLQGLAGPLNDEQEKQLGMVRGSARHLLALINDVLDLSKIEAGEFLVDAESFNLREALEQVVEAVTPMVDEKGLSLSTEVEPGLELMESDRRRVQQIVINLLSNAIKFTDRGGVRLEAQRVEKTGAAEAEKTEAFVRLSVTDTGVGIREEDLKGLFRPFNQLDTGLTRQHDGTGLGLAICERLAALLGGSIAVDSEWGKGSRFSVDLPLLLPDESRKENHGT